MIAPIADSSFLTTFLSVSCLLALAANFYCICVCSGSFWVEFEYFVNKHRKLTRNLLQCKTYQEYHNLNLL